MSFDLAISQRAKMNQDYQTMLDQTTDPTRRAAIEKQIKFNLEEIETLRKEQTKIFGKATPLVQETKIIESDPETKGQKVTVLNPAPKLEPVEPSSAPTVPPSPSPKAKSKRLENNLRSQIQQLKANKGKA